MTEPDWSKGGDAIGSDTYRVSVLPDDTITVSLTQVRAPGAIVATVALTPNQCGDLEHALAEARRKVYPR
ncbi:MAG: hypothetical protein ACSLE9_07925 [Burkholderiaceae bacterium]